MTSVYPRENVRLLAHVSLLECFPDGDEQLHGSDIWGYSDDARGHEFALMTTSLGLAIVNVTVATEPAVVGR
jgi:hypothetical protein